MRIKKDRPSDLKAVVCNELYNWLEVFVWAVVMIALVFIFIGRMVTVVGSSMEPTFYQGQCLLVSGIACQQQRGDIVVFGIPGQTDEKMIKRVIAVAGDTVDIDPLRCEVTVNGEILKELYIMSPTDDVYDFKGPVRIPEGKLFVLGDNRSDSIDSRCRCVGLIDERSVYGKVFCRIYPLWEWAWIE